MENEVKNLDLELFSKERYQYFRDCGLTEEEIKTLERAEAACQTLSLVPDTEEGLDKVFKTVESMPDNPAKAFDAYHELRDKDPDAYMEILATAAAVDMAMEDKAPTSGK